MIGHHALVQKVIEDPLAIYQSASHPNRNVFYRPSELPPPFNRGYIRVIVEYERGWRGAVRGRVITAFLVDRPAQAERMLWPT